VDRDLVLLADVAPVTVAPLVHLDNLAEMVPMAPTAHLDKLVSAATQLHRTSLTGTYSRNSALANLGPLETKVQLDRRAPTGQREMPALLAVMVKMASKDREDRRAKTAELDKTVKRVRQAKREDKLNELDLQAHRVVLDVLVQPALPVRLAMLERMVNPVVRVPLVMSAQLALTEDKAQQVRKVIKENKATQERALIVHQRAWLRDIKRKRIPLKCDSLHLLLFMFGAILCNHVNIV